MTTTESIHMGEVLATWHKREDGRPVSRWLLDDLWCAACSILSAREAGDMDQRGVAEYHHREAKKSLELYNVKMTERSRSGMADVAVF